MPTGEVGKLAVRGPTGCRYLADERQGIDVSGSFISVDAGLSSNPDLTDSGDSDVLLSFYGSTDVASESLPFLVGLSMFLEKYADQSESDFLDLGVGANREYVFSQDSVLDAALDDAGRQCCLHRTGGGPESVVFGDAFHSEGCESARHQLRDHEQRKTA